MIVWRSIYFRVVGFKACSGANYSKQARTMGTTKRGEMRIKFLLFLLVAPVGWHQKADKKRLAMPNGIQVITSKFRAPAFSGVHRPRCPTLGIGPFDMPIICNIWCNDEWQICYALFFTCSLWLFRVDWRVHFFCKGASASLSTCRSTSFVLVIVVATSKVFCLHLLFLHYNIYCVYFALGGLHWNRDRTQNYNYTNFIPVVQTEHQCHIQRLGSKHQEASRP